MAVQNGAITGGSPFWPRGSAGLLYCSARRVTASLWFRRIHVGAEAGAHSVTDQWTSASSIGARLAGLSFRPQVGSRVGAESAEEHDASRPPRPCLRCPGRPARGRGAAGESITRIGVLSPAPLGLPPGSPPSSKDSASSATLRNRPSPSSTDSLRSGRNDSPPSPPSWSIVNVAAILDGQYASVPRCEECDEHRFPSSLRGSPIRQQEASSPALAGRERT